MSVALFQDAEMFLQKWAPLHEPRWRLWLRLLFATPGFQFVFWLRMQRAVEVVPILGPTLRRILWYWTRICFSCEVDTQAQIGAGFYTPHPLGIVIGAGVRIGNNVTISQKVTLGRAGTNHVYPTIGNGVEIGAGAAILGAIEIGNSAKIGANSVVLTDIPTDAIAFGAPARVIHHLADKE